MIPDAIPLESPWFWIAVLALTWILVTLFAERQQAFLALGTIVISLLAAEWWGQTGLLGALVRHPFLAGGLVLAYLVLGAAWSLGRWWLFATAQRTRLAETLLDWLHTRGLPDAVTVPDDLADAWRDHLFDHGAKHLAAPPSFSEHRPRILLWIVYWPFSLMWTAVHDVVVEASRWLMLRLRRLYLWIATWVYRDAPGSFGPESRPNEWRAPWLTGVLSGRPQVPGASAPEPPSW